MGSRGVNECAREDEVLSERVLFDVGTALSRTPVPQIQGSSKTFPRLGSEGWKNPFSGLRANVDSVQVWSLPVTDQSVQALATAASSSWMTAGWDCRPPNSPVETNSFLPVLDRRHELRSQGLHSCCTFRSPSTAHPAPACVLCVCSVFTPSPPSQVSRTKQQRV